MVIKLSRTVAVSCRPRAGVPLLGRASSDIRRSLYSKNRIERLLLVRAVSVREYYW